MLPWLLDDRSLTERIISACSGQFSVVVLTQKWVLPNQQERCLLEIAARQKVLLRQVILYCGDKPVVFAHSLIPLKTLKGQHIQLKFLKNKALGKYLFSKPYLIRSKIQWSLISNQSDQHKIMSQSFDLKQPMWGRRSLFNLKQKKLLVSEYFMPDILTLSDKT